PNRGDLMDLRGWEWRYLWQQCRRDTGYQLGPAPMCPLSIAISRDGRWAAAGEQDEGWLSIYDLTSRKLVNRTQVADSGVRVAFSPKAAMVACATATHDSEGHPQSRVWLRELRDGRLGRTIASAVLNDS